MNYLKRIYKPFIFVVVFILISTFLVTLLNFFNILNYKLTIFAKFLMTIIAFFIGGFKIGKISKKQGWLEGIKFSMFLIIPMVIINLVLKSFEYKALIFYLILIISNIIGSMFGINKKGS